MIDQTATYDYGLIVPEGTDVANFPDDLIAVMKEFRAEFPSARVFGTQPFEGKQIVYVRMQRRVDKDELLGMFKLFNLDWQVIGIRSAYRIIEQIESEDEHGNVEYVYLYDNLLPIDKAAVLPFVPGATLDSTLIVPVYAGTDPIIV